MAPSSVFPYGPSSDDKTDAMDKKKAYQDELKRQVRNAHLFYLNTSIMWQNGSKMTSTRAGITACNSLFYDI